jgi:uncharacterized protein YdbL (DUF1318 family)
MVTTIPSAAVLPPCPSLSDVAATFAPAALSSRFAADAQTWAGVLARPQGRVQGTGAGYAAAAPAVAAKRREVDRDVNDSRTANGKRVIATGTTGSKQQDQLHLMSRRDPRPWRPPV